MTGSLKLTSVNIRSAPSTARVEESAATGLNLPFSFGSRSKILINSFIKLFSICGSNSSICFILSFTICFSSFCPFFFGILISYELNNPKILFCSRLLLPQTVSSIAWICVIVKADVILVIPRPLVNKVFKMRFTVADIPTNLSVGSANLGTGAACFASSWSKNILVCDGISTF